ncbi:MAG TPA: efflux RND transporter periplasmic adaptor subunit [Thermoanaerobaculia bacterium]|nr:efflux RND transporter periplasmic adaptor subunit [Thermoanaerobaculia bacterium]
MKTLLRILTIALLLGSLGLGLAACGGGRSDAAEVSEDGKKGTGGAAADEPKPAVPVEVASLQRGPIEATLEFSTNLEAEEQVGVYSQSARQVRQLFVEEGSTVAKGQVLLRLQDDEQRLRVEKVASQLERARREYDRQKRLRANELISEQAFNDATHELSQLELELTDAQRELSYTTVTAPISGTITARHVGMGDHVTPNQLLFDMVDFDSIVARVFVPEKELPRLRSGQNARITAPALGAAVYRGSIERLAPVVDPKSGTVKVTVDIPRQNGLRPGMYVNVALVTEVRDDALLVPKRALVYDDDQVFVYRMKEDRSVERVYLVPALGNETHVEPQGDELAPGDAIVVAGQAGLKAGAQVRLAGEKDDTIEQKAEAPKAGRGERKAR